MFVPPPPPLTNGTPFTVERLRIDRPDVVVALGKVMTLVEIVPTLKFPWTAKLPPTNAFWPTFSAPLAVVLMAVRWSVLGAVMNKSVWPPPASLLP